MPCLTDDFPPSREQILDAKAPAMLCALISALSPVAFVAALDRADWKAAGVSRAEFDEWHKLHLQRDRKRLAAEAAEAEKKRLRDKALSKLTRKERKALGI